MAIKLLGHVWRATTPGSVLEPRRRSDWGIELREPSRWNAGAQASGSPLPANEQRPTEPVWAETQPWCHD